MVQLPIPLPHEVTVMHPVRMKTRIPDWHDLANSKVGSEIDQDESGGDSVAVAQLTMAKPVELSWKWLSQADGSAFQTPRLGLAW